MVLLVLLAGVENGGGGKSKERVITKRSSETLENGGGVRARLYGTRDGLVVYSFL